MKILINIDGAARDLIFNKAKFRVPKALCDSVCG